VEWADVGPNYRIDNSKLAHYAHHSRHFKDAVNFLNKQFADNTIKSASQVLV